LTTDADLLSLDKFDFFEDSEILSSSSSESFSWETLLAFSESLDLLLLLLEEADEIEDPPLEEEESS